MEGSYSPRCTWTTTRRAWDCVIDRLGVSSGLWCGHSRTTICIFICISITLASQFICQQDIVLSSVRIAMCDHSTGNELLSGHRASSDRSGIITHIYPLSQQIVSLFRSHFLPPGSYTTITTNTTTSHIRRLKLHRTKKVAIPIHRNPSRMYTCCVARIIRSFVLRYEDDAYYCISALFLEPNSLVWHLDDDEVDSGR